jgi:hypothetical protein
MSLFLGVSLRLGFITTRIQQSEKSFDNWTKVGHQSIAFDSPTEIDESGGSMRMYSGEQELDGISR